MLYPQITSYNIIHNNINVITLHLKPGTPLLQIDPDRLTEVQHLCVQYYLSLSCFKNNNIVFCRGHSEDVGFYLVDTVSYLVHRLF